jgi:Tol biopolymer transport system component
VAVATFDDVWTYDVARGTMSRLTTNPAQDRSPLWTPDGLRILFTSMRANYPEVFSKAADGTGTEERLFARAKDAVDLRAMGWSADGRRLLFTEVPATILCAIGHAAVDKLTEQVMLVRNDFCNDYAAVSPDGRWIAYDSVVSGRQEIYVERYPELDSRQQISTGGGRMPLWSANGRELYFSSLDARQMLAVPIQPGPPLTAGGAQVIFEGEFLAPQTGWRPYDVGPDGRFVIIRNGGDSARNASVPLVVVQHWSEELTRLVPAK